MINLLNIILKSYFEYYIKNIIFYLYVIHIDILDNANDICYDDNVFYLLNDDGYFNYNMLYKYYFRYLYI